MLSLDIIKEINSVQIPTVQIGEDRILLKQASDGIYLASSAYQFLNEDGTPETKFWKLIWRICAPERVGFFLWLVGRDALPTNAKRHRSHLAATVSCIRCGATVEDAEHVIRRCPGSIWARNQFSGLLPWIPEASHFRYWLFGHLQNSDHTLFCAMIWNLWKWRNSFVFEQTPWQPGEVLRHIHVDMVEFQKQALVTQNSSSGALEEPNSVTLHTDGSWDPRVNRMGGGGCIIDLIGRWVSGFATGLGVGDALKAELLAVRKGLSHV